MVTVAFDPVDSLDTTLDLEQLNDPRRGIVVVEATAGARGDSSPVLLLDLATALGKVFAADGRLQPDILAGQLTAWLRAEPIRHVIVSRAHLAHAGHWRSLVAVSHAADVQPALLVQGEAKLSRGQREFIQAAEVELVDLDRLLGRLRTGRRRPASRPTPTGFPSVPHDSHALTFRHRCRELLNRDQFAVVADLYDRSRAQATAWTARTRAIDERSVRTLLRKLLPDKPSLDQTLTVLAAVASALWEEEWQLAYDPTRPLERGEQTALATLDETTCATLRRELVTHRPAAAVLALLAPDTPLDALTAIKVGDVAADGSTVVIAGQRHRVPACARPLLRAHRHYREQERASAAEPFITRLSEGRDGVTLASHTPQSWTRLIAAAARRSGLVLTRSSHDSEQHQPTSCWPGIRLLHLRQGRRTAPASAPPRREPRVDASERGRRSQMTPSRRPASFSPAAIERIIELREAGLVLQTIGHQLEREGIDTPRDGRWWAGTVRKALLNAAAEGNERAATALRRVRPPRLKTYAGHRETPPEILDLIADLRYHRQMPLHAIADLLNRNGVPTARGGRRWHQSTVRSALRSGN